VDRNKNIDTKIVLLKFSATSAVVLGTILFLIAFDDYKIVDENILSYSVTVLTVLTGLILIIKGIKNKFLKSYRALDVLNWLCLNFIVFPFFLFSAACTINGAFDQNDSEIFEVKLLETWRYNCYRCLTDSYLMKMASWRTGLDHIQLPITKAEYNELTGQSGLFNYDKIPIKDRYITVETKPVLFSEEWIVSAKINQPGQRLKNNNKQDPSSSGLPSYDGN
jgi:hypothetical protein